MVFPTDPAGLPEATPPTVRKLADGDPFALRISPVAKRLPEATVRMLGYNGSIPGPTLSVKQGTEIVVTVANEGDLDTTVHWHGLRLDNAFDGVPHETQAPIPVGGTFTYRIRFPDPGLYWYHPHIREDYAQEIGLYGNILVEPADPDYWPPADRDVVLTIDDLLVEDGKVAPFSETESTYAVMGRFGNVLLVGGAPAPDARLAARTGEVVRLWLTNTANARVFNVRLPGARLRLVGGDSGRVERVEPVEEVLIAPSERAVVDVLFDRPGAFTLEHRTPDRVYPLAAVAVDAADGPSSAAAAFDLPRTAPELIAERLGFDAWLAAPPDKTLALVAEMGEITAATDGPVTYACPMHPAVTSDRPDHCPHCGMKLVPAALITPEAEGHHEHGSHQEHGGHHEHGGHQEHEHGGEHRHGGGDGIEWEDDMAAVSRLTTSANTRWMLVDRDTGAANAAIDWRFTVGDRVKIRLVNEMDSDHPMHHPFHLHGAGRFLVLARDGVFEPNLVWKDTVLVRTGQVVDILFDVTNPGLWMAHCHIPEHLHSGMMFSFTVARA
jgi:FtsP/CotA-like multicopper oxidase with cupredoxin domain